MKTKKIKTKLITRGSIPIILSSALTLGVVSTSAHALVVSDPTSYSYYVEQLKNGVKQLENIQGTLDQTTRLSNSFDGYMNDLRSQFDFVSNIQRSLNGELSSFEAYKRSLSYSAKKSLDFSRKFDMKDLRDVIDTNLDGIYVDPTNPDYDASSVQKLRTIERQRLLKEGLIKTEEKLTLLEQKYKDIEGLADKAKKTTNTKESMDLNNAILLEILAALHSLIDVTATLGQAEMAAKFINYSKEAHERKEKADNKASSSYPGFNNRREYDEWYDGCHAFKREHGHTNTTVNGVDCPAKAYRKATEERRKNTPQSGKARGL